ncbi:MAG: hypothetical protein U5L96_22175 [Owenweeksia sp.]|nr:hypothetical protein [Owenweeksia sp.]
MKNEHSAVVFQMAIGQDEDDPKMMDLSQPMLFYSRPKGTYSGESAKRVLLDFYLHNTKLSADGYSVMVTGK